MSRPIDLVPQSVVHTVIEGVMISDRGHINLVLFKPFEKNVNILYRAVFHLLSVLVSRGGGVNMEIDLDWSSDNLPS